MKMIMRSEFPDPSKTTFLSPRGPRYWPIRVNWYRVTLIAPSSIPHGCSSTFIHLARKTRAETNTTASGTRGAYR